MICHVIPAHTLNNVTVDIVSVSGLPHSAYHSDDLFRFELNEVNSKSWIGFAFESDLGEVNFAYSVEFFGLSLVAA